MEVGIDAESLVEFAGGVYVGAVFKVNLGEIEAGFGIEGARADGFDEGGVRGVETALASEGDTHEIVGSGVIRLERGDFVEMRGGVSVVIFLQEGSGEFEMGVNEIGRDVERFPKAGDGLIVLLHFGVGKSELEVQQLVRGILGNGFGVTLGRSGEITAGEHFVAKECLEMGIGRAFDALGFEQGGAGRAGRIGMVRGRGAGR